MGGVLPHHLLLAPSRRAREVVELVLRYMLLFTTMEFEDASGRDTHAVTRLVYDWGRSRGRADGARGIGTVSQS